MYGIIIRNNIPVFKPFPVVKSSLELFIIWALQVEQPWEIRFKWNIINKKTTAILFNNLIGNMVKLKCKR